MENIFVEFLPPWVETGLQPAFYDKESGTVLQQTARMYARVNMLIRMFNKLSKQTKETVDHYIEEFTTLYTYVHDYFDNLDVQEEINNKLDQMVESGQMSDLIAQYIGLGALVTFDTLADMISSINVSNGAKCRTLGKYTKNDGYGAYYTIGESGDIELDNGLYATLVPNFGGDNYYDEITWYKERDNDTDCYITTIPKKDSDNNQIDIYVGVAADRNETPIKYAQNHNTTLTANGILEYNPDTVGVGSLIINGVIVRDIDMSGVPSGYKYIGITSNRTLIDFTANATSAQQMLDAGCEQAFLVFFRLIENGAMVDLSSVNIGSSDIVYNKHPRQCIGQKDDGTIILLSSDGRTDTDAGLTSEECADILLAKGCTRAWVMDGGGSTSTVIKGLKINRNIDNKGTEDRIVDYTLNIKKETIDKQLADAYSQIGRAKQLTIQELMPAINEAVNFTHTTDISDGDLDELTEKLIIGLGNNVSNAPENIFSGYFINIPHFYKDFIGKYATQIFSERDTNRTWYRKLVNNVFTPWYYVSGDLAYLLASGINLTVTGDYEAVKFNAQNIEGSSIVTLGDEDPGTHLGEKIKINKRGNIKISVDMQMTPLTTGNKYIQLYYGNTAVDASRRSFYGTINQRTCVHTEWYFTNAFPDNTYTVKVYGASGDAINSCIVNIDA